MAPRPFSIEVPDAVLDDLRERLGRTRWPEPIPGIEDIVAAFTELA